MTHLVIRLKCASGHVQILRLSDNASVEWAKSLAGMLDGTSSHYKHVPSDIWAIGKCGVCGGTVVATIQEYQCQHSPSENPVRECVYTTPIRS